MKMFIQMFFIVLSKRFSFYFLIVTITYIPFLYSESKRSIQVLIKISVNGQLNIVIIIKVSIIHRFNLPTI